MSDENTQGLTPAEDMALRLATARSADTPGEAIFPVTANLTAEEELVEPEKERNNDLDAGA